MNLNEHISRMKDLIKSQHGIIKPLINEQDSPSAELFGTKFFENKDDGAYGEGVFGVSVSQQVSGVKNYYGSGTSSDVIKNNSLQSSVNFNFVKIISGKNEGQSMKILLNGKEVLTIPLSHSSGQEGISYYGVFSVQIQYLQKGKNLITFSVDKSQTNALTINKMYLEVMVS